MDRTSIYDLHGRLLRDTFSGHLSDQDAFLVFLLFHSYRIHLAAPVLTDRPGVLEVAAITQRDAASALASVWSRAEDERAEYYYWYHRWNGAWGSYGHANNLTPAETMRLREIQAQFERHPLVSSLKPED